MRTKFNILFGDITGNCNLRCPFCVNDWPNVAHLKPMGGLEFGKFLKLGSQLSDEYSLSCGMEPTLHPLLSEFVGLIPLEGTAFLTTNLSVDLSDDKIDGLAHSNLKRIQVSVESLKPDVYEYYRRGAKWATFLHNLERLSAAVKGRQFPELHSISMAFEGNLEALPMMLVELGQYGFKRHEIRTPFPFTRAFAPDVFHREFITGTQLSKLRDIIGSIGNVHYLGPDVPKCEDGGNNTGQVGEAPAFAFAFADGTIMLPDGSWANFGELEDPVAEIRRRIMLPRTVGTPSNSG